MTNNLKILLVVFSLLLFLIVLRLISNKKISIKYSLLWLVVSILIFIVGAFPNFIGFFTKKIGFETTSNLVIGIILTLLLFITLILTVIVADQKKKIKLLIQETSIIKSRIEEEKNENDAYVRDLPEVRENDSEWIKVFYKMVKSNYAITGMTALGVLYKRDYIIKNNYYFDESFTYFSDLVYLTKVMCGTENVIQIRMVLYIKRKHNDPINLPSLSQISDTKNKMLEVMRAYLLMKEYIKGKDERAELYIDGKFIKYYVIKIAPFYLHGEPEEIPEVREMADKCLPLIQKAAKKKSMLYSQSLMKYSANHTSEQIAGKVRRHSARQTFFRLMRSKSATKKYLYRKWFSKMELMNHTVVFESFLGRNYSDSPKYVYEYLCEKYPGKFNCIWIRGKHAKFDLPYPAKQVKRFSLKYFYYMGRAKYFVFNGRQPKYFIKREGTVFLETWHGTPLKRLVFDQNEVMSATPLYKRDVYLQSRSWDYLIAPNKFCSEIFARCFMFDNTMLETGYPRNDILHRSEEETKRMMAEIKAELGIPDGKKVILYAPTWRDDEYFDSGQYKFSLQLDLDMLREKLGDDYVVVLRTHYFIVDALNLEDYEGFAFNGSGGNFDDIARLYLIADILITDYSSVFFDYANLKRPMLFFTYDLEKYRGVLRGFYLDMEEEVPGPMLFNTAEIVDAVQRIDEITEEYKDKYDKFYDKYCGWEHGDSTKKVVDVVFADDIK